MDLELSFAMTPYDRVLPLISGEIKPQGITLRHTDLTVPDMFYRQLKFAQFDVSEMSISSFFRARGQGWGYRMLPVFHNRNFSYTRALVRLASGVRVGHPEDLKGKRVGIADYQMSIGLWTRGILQHEFGVMPQDMEWYQERSQRLSHGGATEFKPPTGVRFHYAATDFGTMLLAGELDVAITYLGEENSKMERSKVDLSRNPKFKPLFGDVRREGTRLFKKLGFVPPHHITVVRESLLREQPWVALSLMDAFQRAKDLTLERLSRSPFTISTLIFGPQMLAEQRATLGDDPHVYGVKANAGAIEMAQTFSLEQGLTSSRQPWDELFPEEVLIAEDRIPGELPAVARG